jgi:hypothetical protein
VARIDVEGEGYLQYYFPLAFGSNHALAMEMESWTVFPLLLLSVFPRTASDLYVFWFLDYVDVSNRMRVVED